MTRVALSLDDEVLLRARRISKLRKTSISKLFVAFITAQSDHSSLREHALPPLTKQALGLGKGKSKLPDSWDYHDLLGDALSEKYEAQA